MRKLKASYFIKSVYALISIAVLVAAMSFNVPSATVVVIKFNSYVGNTPLKLDSITYKNELDQPYTVSKFRYYIGNIALNTKEKEMGFPRMYKLIDEADSDSQKLILHFPSAYLKEEFINLSFILGVDSEHNCSGAQSGVLDPINGMFWTWNTGYIFLKMEGQSAASKSPGHLLEFHIGGYKAPYNCVRQVKLTFKKPLMLDGVVADTINVKVDLSQLFKAHTTVDFSKLSSVTDFHNSTTIADNYQAMFSLQ